MRTGTTGESSSPSTCNATGANRNAHGGDEAQDKSHDRTRKIQAYRLPNLKLLSRHYIRDGIVSAKSASKEDLGPLPSEYPNKNPGTPKVNSSAPPTPNPPKKEENTRRKGYARIKDFGFLCLVKTGRVRMCVARPRNTSHLLPTPQRD